MKLLTVETLFDINRLAIVSIGWNKNNSATPMNHNVQLKVENTKK